MEGPSHQLHLNGDGGAMAEGVLNDNFVDINSLELLGMPFNASHEFAYNQESAYTPRSMDSLDRLLDNCHFSFCPLLQAKLCTRLKGRNGTRGRIGLSMCHWPWRSSNKLRHTWFELQFKPQGSRWCQAVTASSRQTSLQCVSKQVHLPGFLSRLVFQVAAGVSLWDGSARRRRLQPLLLWKLTGKSAVNSAYKFEWDMFNLKTRLNSTAALMMPEIGGGMGHEGDELCSYEDMGVRVAVRKLSVRLHLREKDNAEDSDDDDMRYTRSSLWNPRAWCSKSILDTRMGL